MDSDNLSKQIEEVEALTSIYGTDFITDSEQLRSYSITIRDKKLEVILSVTLPSDYPGQAPPKYEFSAPWMDREKKENLRRSLDEVYLENVGETVVFQWVEKIREILHKLQPPDHKKKGKTVKEVEIVDISKLEIISPKIVHGNVIIDRRSSFQGHAAEVHSIDDVNAVLMKLKQNKKIQNATHNMYAYRIECPSEKGTCVLQDCDDDGETHAGGRMLHLLQILEQKNTLVVVSRWYGGIQLGPDRFRHINNATRQVIEEAGLLNKAS
ncbi:protein IMPACT-B-like [Leptidea sinapis]|uniref:protein IMPACT-B-like n=1 Tax=Leptidea sinapis TaxID=189913 RepID=UPI00212F8A39|nr:protein IMPACT-B-like [Leptidea sinapis]